MQLTTEALEKLTAGKSDIKGVTIKPGIDRIIVAYQRQKRISYSEAVNHLVLFGSEALKRSVEFESE